MNQLGYFKTSELILRMLFILNTRKFMQRHRNNTSTFTYRSDHALFCLYILWQENTNSDYQKKALREAYKTEIEIFEWLFTCLKFFLIIAGTAYIHEDMFCLSLVYEVLQDVCHIFYLLDVE